MSKQAARGLLQGKRGPFAWSELLPPRLAMAGPLSAGLRDSRAGGSSACDLCSGANNG